MAATLSVPASAVSGRSAAALLDFPGWKRSRIELVTRYGAATRSPFATVHRSSTIGRFTVVEGVRVVSAADCLVQLSAGLDADALGPLIDSVGRTRRSVLPELRDRYVAVAHSRVPGVAALRGALEKRGPGYVPPASELERHLRLVLAAARPPSVDFEVTPPWLERGAGRVDALVPAWNLVVEGDGRDWHTRVADFEHDRWRDTTALAHGHATVRLTWDQLVHHTTWCRNALIAVGADRSRTGGSKRAA